MTVLRRDYKIETRRAIIRKYGSYALRQMLYTMSCIYPAPVRFLTSLTPSQVIRCLFRVWGNETSSSSWSHARLFVGGHFAVAVVTLG